MMRVTYGAAGAIARDASSEAGFCGDLQLVYRPDGTRYGFFAGGNVYVTQWSLYEPGSIVIHAGNGRRFDAQTILDLADTDDEDYA